MKPFEVSRTDPSDETLFPLSAAQRATWFAQQFDPEVPILIAHYVELRGELDVELLDRETASGGIRVSISFAQSDRDRRSTDAVRG